MNVTRVLQTILCAGVTHLVLSRSTTVLLGQGGEIPPLRTRIRLKPREQRPAATRDQGVPR